METLIKTNQDILKVQSWLREVSQKIKDGKTFDCEIKQHRETRSLNANAYFHVLVNKIAAKLNLGNEEVKKSLVLEYGAVAEMSDGKKFAVQIPEGEDITQFYPYAKWYGTIEDNGVKKDKYLLYKHTHTLDSKEMARLIDGTVQDAKQLGIETKTPQQLAEMKSLWRTAK